MKNIALASFVLIYIALTGCEAAPKSTSTSGVKVHVVAKPKAGADTGQRITRVAVYDAAPPPAPAATGTYERVDYSNLSDIIVWLEPVARGTPAVTLPHTMNVDPQKPSSYVHAASVGQKINFRNTSARPTVLYSVADGNEFELSSIAPGATASYVPK
ncbi:MAG: hypothetical protein H7Z14_21585, partial [Anaerolineae bacterium]|nr:hypothetical protein [Phycisphaerae bacterium]